MAITQEQLDFRKGKIGASDAAAALGISKWKTQAALFHEIKGNFKPEPLGEKGIIGNDMEVVIMAAYERATGIKVLPPGETLVHPEHPWMIANLDGRMPDYEMILEIKNVGPRMVYDWGEDGDPSGVPIYVAAQITQQALLANVDRVDVAAFFGGNELRVYPVDVTKSAKETVFNKVKAFWDNHITANVQPEVTEKDLELLKTLYSKVKNDKIMEVEGTATAISFESYRHIKAQIKELEAKADKYKAAIQDVMKDHTVLSRGDDWEFTWRKTKDGKKINWELVAKELSGIIAGYGLYTQDCGDSLKDAIAKYTTTKIGHRVFLDKGK